MNLERMPVENDPRFPVPGSPERAAIFCRGLSKTYGAIRALDGLDLAVPRGSVFGFLGRNGAGKTTTMRLLTGLAFPSAGRAWIDGRETTGADRLARARFGYLPQNPAFYSWMSAREYLGYVGRILELPAQARRRQIEELLELSGLNEAARRRIGGFSGGMIQRLGIAQAMIGDPPVLLLDEPTSSLDPAGRHEVLEMISRIRGPRTVFFSSHILNDVERVCDSLAVLHQGRLLLISGMEQLLARYPVNAAEVEWDPTAAGEGGAQAAFHEELRGRPWVANIVREGPVVRILVHSAADGKRELMPLIVKHGLTTDRLEWVRPSLEEIFLKMSS
ncbi:MAG: ABC transporter ATP-binding protein [Anaerolineales bacterium]|nr:ABC transporter ATP-binding protein [Anaerolineales bacterium]